MTALALVLLLIVGLAAAGFAAWPIFRQSGDRGRYVLGAAAILFVLGVGGAGYVLLGHPYLAVRTIKGKDDRSMNALIGRLADAVKKHPSDPRGWALLGQYYLTANDPTDSAAAFQRAIDAAAAKGEHYSFLHAAYGEALVQASAGAVTPDAEAAFDQALALDPKDQSARYFLGLAEASRGNAPKALAYWNSLLPDVPLNSELHADLVDRIAALTARSGGTAPNIADMVAGLAARLKAQPNDPDGWQRLIRAYTVLGDKAKARAALSDARNAFRGHGDVIAALDAEAKSLGL